MDSEQMKAAQRQPQTIYDTADFLRQRKVTQAQQDAAARWDAIAAAKPTGHHPPVNAFMRKRARRNEEAERKRKAALRRAGQPAENFNRQPVPNGARR